MRAGGSQLVLLGAGYDTRATRLPAAAASAVFEIDHPLTQSRKRAVLGDAPSTSATSHSTSSATPCSPH